MKKVQGRILRVEKNSSQGVTRLVLDYAGRVRYASFKGRLPKGVEVGRSYRIVVDDAELRLVECRLLDKYGNISKRVFPV